MASKLDIDVSGVPDGTYKTILTNPVDDSVVFASDVGYVSGIATTGDIAPDVGTSLTGFVIDNQATHLNGAVIYGVTVSTGDITSKVLINLEPTASAHYSLSQVIELTGHFEVEIMVESTSDGIKKIFDGNSTSNRLDVTLNDSTIGARDYFTPWVDGVQTSTLPTDGKLHTLKLVRDATNADQETKRIGLIGVRYSITQSFNGILSDFKYTDITTPANSLVFGLDNLTGNTEINNGVTLTYQNIATTVDVRDTYTLSNNGTQWVGSLQTIDIAAQA